MSAAGNQQRKFVTRFAPSPNGSLHLGHAFSALVAHDIAKNSGGEFLLRIEDIDGPRSKPEFADEFRRDLEWLGLEWREVPAQSTRLEDYQDAADNLLNSGLLYPCSCTRRQLVEAPNRLGFDGVEYPGGCDGRCGAADDPSVTKNALRLNIDKALDQAGMLEWRDEIAGVQLADPRQLGDVVLVRKDLPASYHLAATLDDARDGVTLVTRGRDLFEMTAIHRLLQQLLKLPIPQWLHHDLLLDDDGEKLAKRRGSPALSERRMAGESGTKLAENLRKRVKKLEIAGKKVN